MDSSLIEYVRLISKRPIINPGYGEPRTRAQLVRDVLEVAAKQDISFIKLEEEGNE